MIDLLELRTKLSNILNGKDYETITAYNSFDLSDFEFLVQTYGTHLDNISDNTSKKNFIPVYIANQDGNVEPIPNLENVNLTYTIHIYFPLEFRDRFISLSKFFLDVFVGKILTYGQNSGKGLSNISVPNYADINKLDFTEFKNWVATNYEMPTDLMGLWGQMTFRLYISQYNPDLILGNQFTYSLVGQIPYINNGQMALYDSATEELIVRSCDNAYQNQIVSEQTFDDYEATSFGNINSTSKQVICYVKNDTFWNRLVSAYENGYLSQAILQFKKQFGEITYTKDVILDSFVIHEAIGEPSTASFSVVKKGTL